MLNRYIPKLVVIATQGVGSVPEETCPWPARVTIYTCHRYLTQWELCNVPVATPKPNTKEKVSTVANAVDGAEGTSAIANAVNVADPCGCPQNRITLKKAVIRVNRRPKDKQRLTREQAPH